MFKLLSVREKVKVTPDKVAQLDEEVASMLEAQYTQKILDGEGLVLKVKDLTIGDTTIVNGEGDLQAEVTCQLLVFRPSKDDILEGTVSSQTSTHIQINLGFCKVTLPEAHMQKKSEWIESERTWVWNKELFYDRGEKIKVKVFTVHFERQKEGEDPTPMIIVKCNEAGLGLEKWWEGQN